MRKSLSLLLILLILILSFSSCASRQPVTEQFFAMDTVMSITCYGKDAKEQISAAKAEIMRLDAMLNAEDPSSDLSSINHSYGQLKSTETFSLTETALGYCSLTEGAFDITLHPVSQLWGFSGGNYRVPSSEELDALRSTTGYEQIVLSENSLTLPDGFSIDLGGIAKGYASDRVAEILENMGAESTVLSLGGNIRVLGSKPDGKPYTVGIQDPSDTASLAMSVDVSDTSVITSGSYQRFFEENGKTYHHILDPETLAPAENGLLSVTVICRNGAYADALSTALFVMGTEKAADFYRKSRDFELILIDKNGNIYYSEGLSPKDLSNGTYQYHKIAENS